MKKLFGLLIFILIGLISFGYCDYLNGLQFITNVDYNGGNALYQTTPAQLGFPSEQGLFCFNINNWGGGNRIVIGRNGTNTSDYRFQTDRSFAVKLFGCFLKSAGTDNIPVYIGAEYFSGIPSFNIDFYYIPTVDYEIVSGNPGYTSLQCQTEYNLIPISSVDQNYCVNNGLCPSSSGTGDCDYGSGDNWSALFINNIQHLGKPIINVTIPDYIYWDYEINEDVFNLYVGSGYDQDYIDSVISINSYRPDTNDFTDIFVSGLTLIMPYIVILLFIVFIRKFIKRIFK